MRTNARRRIASVGVAVGLAVAGIQWGAARDASAGDPIEKVVSVRRVTFPPRTSTTVRRGTTTTRPPTSVVAPTAPTTQAPAPSTTKAPATTTTKAPVTTTTKAPATTTTKAPTTTAPAPAPAPSSGALSSATASEMLAQLNAKRASGTTCGGVAYPPVPALSLQGNLAAAANNHAVDMATRNYFSHTGANGSDPGTRMSAAGYRWSAWAENIAAGQTTGASVMAGWFSSTGHCKNFMSSAVTQVGFAMADNPAASYRYYWVADLGRPG